MFEKLIRDRQIAVVEGKLPTGWWGAYDASKNTIILRTSLAPLQRRSTLAHETAHAVLGHHRNPSTLAYLARMERDAEELAASWLIKHQEFTCATGVHETVQAVAHELHVLPRDVRAYVRALERTTLR